MARLLLAAAGLLLLIGPARAQDAIPAETVTAVKRATVFIQVRSGLSRGSGSGFVVSADKDTVLIATNYHVVSLKDDFPAKMPHDELMKSMRDPTIKVVFDSGTPTERSARAVAVAGDPGADLAVLRVTGLTAPPKPIDYATAPTLSETMSVYTFGFPFGEALATGRGAPAVTVGKGSVSSLRLDRRGDLVLVQIDGALNPGNSGGPVVDSKGRLAGVAVATIKNGQGIGFAVPVAQLAKLLKVRLGEFQVKARRAADNKLTVQAEIDVIDPTAAVRTVTLHYVAVGPNVRRPAGKEPVERHPAAKKLVLAVERGVATGSLTFDATDRELYVQAAPDGSTGRSEVQRYGLAYPKGAVGAVELVAPELTPSGPGAGEGPAPAGWKEYTAYTGTYKAWLPERAEPRESQSESRDYAFAPRVAFFSVTAAVPDGPTYAVDHLVPLPALDFRPAMIIPNRAEVLKALRAITLRDLPGAKLVEETEARIGQVRGTELVAEGRESATRARGYVDGYTIYLVRVTGTREQVESGDATRFLDSWRRHQPELEPAPAKPAAPNAGMTRPTPPQGGGATQPAPAPQGPGTQSSELPPEFKDLAPEGGLLVGLEVGLGKFFDSDVVFAARPVYRTGDKESHGKQLGSNVSRVVKVVAKPGYAVGAITTKTGAGLDGLSLTFMKVAGEKLDPKDSYESDWLGGQGGGGPEKHGGDGSPVTGVHGRTNGRDVTSLKPVSKGQAMVAPSPPVGAPEGTDWRILGHPFDPVFKDEAPAGGLLVGLEVGTAPAFGHQMTRSVRPIYRTAGKETTGKQWGTQLEKVVTLKAKEGYAVGAISCMHGLGFDGVTVTFMKVTADGRLDPKDSYESEYVGAAENKALTRLGGDGAPVIGIVGRSNNKDMTGMGLLFKDAGKK